MLPQAPFPRMPVKSDGARIGIGPQTLCPRMPVKSDGARERARILRRRPKTTSSPRRKMPLAERGLDCARNRTCQPRPLPREERRPLMSGVWAAHVIARASSGPTPSVVGTRNRTCATRRSPQAHVIARVLAWEEGPEFRASCCATLPRASLFFVQKGPEILDDGEPQLTLSSATPSSATVWSSMTRT